MFQALCNYSLWVILLKTGGGCGALFTASNKYSPLCKWPLKLAPGDGLQWHLTKSYLSSGNNVLNAKVTSTFKPTLHHHELYQFWIIIMTRKIWKYNPELHSYSWLVLDWSLGFRIQNSGFLIHILCFMLYWFLHESKNSREWKWSWIKHGHSNSGWIQDEGHNSWSRMSIF